MKTLYTSWGLFFGIFEEFCLQTPYSLKMTKPVLWASLKHFQRYRGFFEEFAKESKETGVFWYLVRCQSLWLGGLLIGVKTMSKQRHIVQIRTNPNIFSKGTYL